MRCRACGCASSRARRSDDEIGVLTRTFNEMMDRLSTDAGNHTPGTERVQAHDDRVFLARGELLGQGFADQRLAGAEIRRLEALEGVILDLTQRKELEEQREAQRREDLIGIAVEGIERLILVGRLTAALSRLDRVINVEDLVYFLSLIAFWLFANVVIVETKKAD